MNAPFFVDQSAAQAAFAQAEILNEAAMRAVGMSEETIEAWKRFSACALAMRMWQIDEMARGTEPAALRLAVMLRAWTYITNLTLGSTLDPAGSANLWRAMPDLAMFGDEIRVPGTTGGRA